MALEWTKRASSNKGNRISYTQFLNELRGSRQSGRSQSVERPSKIPLKSVNQGKDKNVQNQNKLRSKSHISHVSSETPLSHGKVTPSNIFMSKTTPGASSSVKTYHKDPRNLQDKEFIKEASQLVQAYFQETCPDILINNSEIKPMTIKMFIAMINHLFEVLGILDKGKEPIQFGINSYEKELPYWMKKLEYPGLITKAWLQTVNVPQYWPHVVGLLSWLVKLVCVKSLFDMEQQLYYPPENRNQHWAVFFFKKSMDAFRFYNEGKEKEINELNEEVVMKFRELNGCHDNILKEIEAEILELKEKLEDPILLANKDSYDEAEQQLVILQSQHQKLLDDIEKKKIDIEEWEGKLIKKKKNCEFLKDEIEKTKTEIENLKTTISLQSMSVDEVADIQKKTGYLDKEIKYLEKECEDYTNVIGKYEVEAAGVRDKILQSSHAFNRNIIQMEQMIPELKEFHIYIDLENENVVSDMEKTVKSLETLKSIYLDKHQTLQENLTEIQKKINEKKQYHKELIDSLKNQEKKNEEQKKENEKLQKNYQEKEKLLKEEVKICQEKIFAVQEKMKELHDFKEKKLKLESKHESLSKTLTEKKLYWEEFWKTIHTKWNGIPMKLEYLIEKVKKQNEELEVTLLKDRDDLA